MLAAKFDSPEDFKAIRYPVWCSPKLDGIRVYCHPTLGPVTRTLKPVANKYVREYLSHPTLRGLDGEVIVGLETAEDVFQKTSSGVMSHGGSPDFKYVVFDYCRGEEEYASYDLRILVAKDKVNAYNADLGGAPSRLELIETEICRDSFDLDVYEQSILQDGYEGVMLRDSRGKYKFGRSTLKEFYLVKLKRFEDAEAKVVGFQALERNQNIPTRDLRGLTERSDHKAGKVTDNLLGAITVEHPDFGTFNIGSGFDHAQRVQIWAERDSYLGKLVTFKFQKVGIKEAPRFPIFKGFRQD
jgi:DNA ligase-1